MKMDAICLGSKRMLNMRKKSKFKKVNKTLISGSEFFWKEQCEILSIKTYRTAWLSSPILWHTFLHMQCIVFTQQFKHDRSLERIMSLVVHNLIQVLFRDTSKKRRRHHFGTQPILILTILYYSNLQHRSLINSEIDFERLTAFT